MMRVAACVMVLGFAPMARAAPECAKLAAFDHTDWSVFDLPAPQDCVTSLTLGAGQTVSCHWSYPFRSDAARRDFDHVKSVLSGCLSASAPHSGVNHPDSYDLVEFVGQSQIFAVSLKDKGALQRTLIFLRFGPSK